MDIILCKFNLDSRILEFSGANRPLWIMRNENKILEEYKTDKDQFGKEKYFFVPMSKKLPWMFIKEIEQNLEI